MTAAADPTTDPTAQDPDESDEELDDTEDGEETETGEPEWTPPTRQQWAAAEAKLKRAREQARKLREAQAATPAAAGDPQAAAAAQADLEKWQTRAVSTAAKAELLARGADPDMVDLALGRLKVSAVEFGDDDQPDLEDWLDEIQERYPKLFKPADAPAAPARPRAGRVETPAGNPVRPKMGLGAQILANSQGDGRPRRRA